MAVLEHGELSSGNSTGTVSRNVGRRLRCAHGFFYDEACKPCERVKVFVGGGALELHGELDEAGQKFAAHESGRSYELEHGGNGNGESVVEHVAHDTGLERSQFLSFFISWLLEEDDPRGIALRLWASAFAFGLPVTIGKSRSAVASAIRCPVCKRSPTREALNKRVLAFQDRFGSQTRDERSDGARSAYSQDKASGKRRVFGK